LRSTSGPHPSPLATSQSPFGLLYDYVDMRLQGVSWRELQRQKLPSWRHLLMWR
jgi:hypothetical protein